MKLFRIKNDLSGTARRKPSQRGSSISEMILALAVVVIVSIAALTMIRRSTAALNNARAEQDAILTARNALEAFKYADNLETFLTLYPDVASGVASDGSFTLSFDNYFVICQANYINPENEVPTFTAVGKDRYDRVFFSISYQKTSDGGETS